MGTFKKLQMIPFVMFFAFVLYTCDTRPSDANESHTYKSEDVCGKLSDFKGAWLNDVNSICICQQGSLWMEHCLTYSPQVFLIYNVKRGESASAVSINSFYNQYKTMKNVSVELKGENTLRLTSSAGVQDYSRTDVNTELQPKKGFKRIDRAVIRDLPEGLKALWKTGRVHEAKDDFSFMEIDFCQEEMQVRYTRSINGHTAVFPDVPHGITVLTLDESGIYNLTLNPLLKDGAPYDGGAIFDISYDREKKLLFIYDELVGRNVLELTPSRCAN